VVCVEKMDQVIPNNSPVPWRLSKVDFLFVGALFLWFLKARFSNG
jgi:hypothetical protein